MFQPGDRVIYRPRSSHVKAVGEHYDCIVLRVSRRRVVIKDVSGHKHFVKHYSVRLQ